MELQLGQPLWPFMMGRQFTGQWTPKEYSRFWHTGESARGTSFERGRVYLEEIKEAPAHYHEDTEVQHALLSDISSCLLSSLWHRAGLHLPFRHNYYFILIFFSTVKWSIWAQLNCWEPWWKKSISDMAWNNTQKAAACGLLSTLSTSFCGTINLRVSEKAETPIQRALHFYLLFIGRNISCRRYSNHTFI